MTSDFISNLKIDVSKDDIRDIRERAGELEIEVKTFYNYDRSHKAGLIFVDPDDSFKELWITAKPYKKIQCMNMVESFGGWHEKVTTNIYRRHFWS